MSSRATRLRAGEKQDGGRAILWINRLMSQSALGVELREHSAKLIIGGPVVERIEYLVSDEMTRSRGNIVEPLTTVAGLIPFTRTFGASDIANSRTRWFTAALLTS